MLSGSFCCKGKPASEVCGAPVNPCADPSAFEPGNQVVFGQSCSGWSSLYPTAKNECDTKTPAGFTKDVAMNIGFAQCCSSGDITPTCPPRDACFQKVLECFFAFNADPDKDPAEAALYRNDVKAALDEDGNEDKKTGDCFQAVELQVGGMEGCCKPVKSAVECMEKVGDDWGECPGLRNAPFEISETAAMSVSKSFQTGGYCTVKPWTMGKGDKVTYLEKELKAARDKKAEAGCDAACKRTTDDLIASLDVSLAEASATTAPDTTTVTTTTTAPVATEDSAALLFGPAWAAAVAAAGLVAAAL
jgi:hypothetical protein